MMGWVRVEVAVGQGRERGRGVRTYTGTSSPPRPLSRPWSTVEKGLGVAVGWKEGWWRLAEMGELFEMKAPTGYHHLELSMHGKS